MPFAIVTGSNRGIGLELVRSLRQRGWDVAATCRTSSPALDALGATVLTGIELTSEEGLDRLENAVRNRRIALLINNAGILQPDSLDALDPASVRKQFEANAMAPLLVTHRLRTQFENPSKVAIITSRMGSIGDNTSGGMYGYRMSKAAVNMAGVSLAHDLKAQGTSVAIIHPGFVRTDMTGGSGQFSPEEAAQGILARIDALTPENTGTFWHQNGSILPW